MKRYNTPYLVFMAVTLLVCCTAVPAFGAAVPQTTEQLVSNSSGVVRGNVISQESRWDDAHTVILTEVRIEVTDVVFGTMKKGGTILVYIPGGLVNDTGLTVEHAPEFNDGEDVVLFLTELEGLYSVTSWEMGKFTIINGNIREKNLPVADFVSEIKSAQR